MPLTNNQGFGVGQTWQDVSASRVNNTTYTNTTGKPILVSVSTATRSNTNETLAATVNGVVIGHDQNGTNFSFRLQKVFVVPANGTYSVNASLGGTLVWAELR